MRTTAIFSYKGGTGKTTTVINLAAELAARGKRVVLIDADGQRNLTDFFGADPEQSSLYELLAGQDPYVQNLMQQTSRELMSIVPSNAMLATIELERVVPSGDATLRLGALRDFCEALAEDGVADFVLIDCPPSFAPQTVAALIAADDVIVPVTPDQWAVSGLRDVSVSLSGARRSNHRLRIAGVLLTKVTASATARDTEAALRGSSFPTFDTVIHRSEWAGRSSFASKALRECAHWTGIAADYKALCDEYLEGGVSNG